MLVVALAVVPAGAEPTGTIGVADVEVLVESEPDEDFAGVGFCPLGITMGVDSPPPPPPPPLPPLPPPSPPFSLPVSEFSCGGQSTLLGGQLSVLDPDEPPGGAQPAPAPKSPAVVQSAAAMPTTGSRVSDPASTTAAAALRQRRVDILEALTA